jgi:translation initiation factor IF-3
MSKKKQHVIQVKEIKFRPKTEEHDYQFKIRHAMEFLGKMNKVKFTVIFRGRELDHRELGMRMLKRAASDLEEYGFVERGAMFEGRLMTMFMSPHPAKQGQQPKKKKESDQTKDAADEAPKPAPKKEAPADDTPIETPPGDPSPDNTAAGTPPAGAHKKDSGGEDSPKEG